MTKIDQLLLIDDSDATNNFHNRIFNKMNLVETISVCTNGKEGLEFLRSTEKYPNLIFLDLNMPVLDGFEFLQQVHTVLDKDSENLPYIVILTSSEELVDKTRCSSYYDKVLFYSKPLTVAQIHEIWQIAID